jgi:hypothetical protein
MVDPLHRKAGVQLVPRGALVGMQHGALGDALADRRHGRGLGWRHLVHGTTPYFLYQISLVAADTQGRYNSHEVFYLLRLSAISPY